MAALKDLDRKKEDLTIRPFLRKDLLRLYNVIVESHKQDCHQNDIEQIKEFNQLVGHCTNQNHVEASTFSCKLLIKLCHHKIISIDVLLKKFLTISAISKNITCSVSSIFELIMMDIKEQINTHGTYTCPYRMKSPQHPLITIFQQWQDSSEIIITEMKNCFERESKQERITPHILNSMMPFLSFIFLDPKRASKSWVATSCSTALIHLMKQMDEIGERYIAVVIAKFLLKMIACRKVNELLTCGNTSITEQLAYCLLELRYSDDIADVVAELGYTVMSQCHKLAQMNLNTSVHLNLMLKIFVKYPKLFISEEFVYMLALLLYRIPSAGKEVALKLAIHLLPCYSSSCKSSTQLRVFETFFLPLMAIMSNNLGLQEEDNLQILAENVFMNIDTYLAASTDSLEIDKEDFEMSIYSPLELIIAKHHCSLLHEINRSESSALAFLTAVKESKNCFDSNLLVLSSLFVKPENNDILAEALKVLLELGKIDSKVGLQFLPLLLHTSSCSTNSMITFQILEFLPSLAINKHLVSPILKAVMMLSNCSQLLPLSIRLTTDLWKMQPRIFPYLFQLLSKKIKASEMFAEIWEEVAIAKATSIFEICRTRPVQHGPDVIGLLAKVFDDFEQGTFGTRSEVAETAVYLSLEALKSLCEAEVSDFQTAWAVVAAKIMSHSSDLILKGIISLLSIIPLVLGITADDVGLRKFACNFIWSHVTHQNFNISSAASVYLTNFSTGEFIVEKLPAKIRIHAVDLLVRKHNLKKREEDDNYDPEKELLVGPVYVYLLENLNGEAAKGYSILLSKVLKEELEMLPRNVSSASTATKLISTYDKYIESIPEFLKSFYEKNSNPALIQSIAGGLHSSYTNTLHLSRSGKIGRRHLIDNAKASRKMLDNLLSEISFAQMDWQQSVTSPTSWSNFMRRVYDSTIEGRKAELSLQYDHGRFSSKDDLDNEVSNASYWARDELTHQLMRASRGHPTSQGNSVLALAGLAVTIANGNGPMDDKNQSQQYTDTKNWLVKVADTIMVVLDGNFKANGQPFQWCQQFSSHKSTASSLLSRSCAAVALSEVAAALIFVDVERIKQISNLLMSRIPGQEKSGTSAVIQFNASLGLGMLLKRLQQERFNDVTGEDGVLLTSKAFQVLHETINNKDLQNREGALFGYGLALGSLCLDPTKESRSHASKACRDLLDIVSSFKIEQRIKPMDEGYFFALGASAINGFRAGVISIEFIMKSIDVVKEASKAHKQSPSLLTIYGFVLHGALSSGLSQVQDIVEENVDIWLNDVANTDKEFEERISSIHGLFSVFGAMSFLFPCDDLDSFNSSLKNKLTITIKTLERIMETNGDAEFCMYSCRLLSLFYMSHHGGAPRQIALPSNYNYLPETSLLRNLFTCLIDAGKSGPRGRLSEPAVNSILSSLISVAELRLPPANWPQVLNPLVKIGFGEESRRLCLKFAIRIASSCPTVPTWLLSWTNPSVFLTLELSCKKEILSSISTVITAMPLNKVKMIIEELMVKIFQNEDKCLEEQLLALESLKKLASIANPVQSSLVCIKCALIQICKDEAIIKNQVVIKSVAEVLLCLPNELKCSVLNSLQTMDLIICMESALVSFFQSSLKCMERTFHIASADPASLTLISTNSIKSALRYHFLNGPSANEHDQRVMWFFDQLGKTKQFIANGMADKANSWLGILAYAMSIWSTSGLHIAPLDNEICALRNTAFIGLFGVNLSQLLSNNDWKNLREKVLNWLMELAETCQTHLDEDIAALFSLFKGAILRLSLSSMGISQENWIKSMDIVLSK